MSARVALSKRFPMLAPLIEELKILEHSWATRGAAYRLERDAQTIARTTVYSRHKSVLLRRDADSSSAMHAGKLHNLALAAPRFDGLVLRPGQVLSFWRVLGRASRGNGFAPGMLISDGSASLGVGGGLCQLANLLYWMALHSPLEVVEHHHHSVDLFPDSGRVLPFGSGASVYFNYVDLRVKNVTDAPIALKVWLDERFLHGELWTNARHPHSYRIQEEAHGFYRRGAQVYRTNRLYQLKHERRNGVLVDKRLVTHNDSRVLYTPAPEVPILETPPTV
jgi:vancomycin resistance protein VanW